MSKTQSLLFSTSGSFTFFSAPCSPRVNFTSSSSPSSVAAAEVTMTVEDGVASAVVDASLEGSYRLCYKFGEIGIQNTAAVVDVVGASVTGQTSEYNAWFSVAN